jgi:hypothetical protein
MLRGERKAHGRLCGKAFAFPRASALTTPLGWKAQPSSRGGGKEGGLRRKARGFPHGRRRSRFSPDFDADLNTKEGGPSRATAGSGRAL